MDSGVIVCKTVNEWDIKRSKSGEYSWCFWVKCEDSEARNAEEGAISYLLEQRFRDANIAYEVVNTTERTEPLNQKNVIISPLCYEMYK
jgi:hypothetical protein